MEIRRDIYLDKLISKKHNKLIKVIRVMIQRIALNILYLISIGMVRISIKLKP